MLKKIVEIVKCIYFFYHFLNLIHVPLQFKSLLMIVMPYLLWGIVPASNKEYLIYLRAIALILCSLIITYNIWPLKLHCYIPTLWYITLTYCLPFMSTMMLILTNGAIEYTINIAISIMLLILLVDWIRAITIGILGTTVAVLFYKFFIKTEGANYDLSFNTVYLLIYQIIFGTIIGLLFARKKQIKVKELEKGCSGEEVLEYKKEGN